MFKKIQLLTMVTLLILPPAYFSWCGDGFIDEGEDCDLGLQNKNDPDISGCTSACKVQTTGKWTCTKTKDGYERAQEDLSTLYKDLLEKNKSINYKTCGAAPTITTVSAGGGATTQLLTSTPADCDQFIINTIKFIDLNKNTKFAAADLKNCEELKKTEINKLDIANFDPKTMTKIAKPYTIQCK